MERNDEATRIALDATYRLLDGVERVRERRN
jgi:hypothetical protein